MARVKIFVSYSHEDESFLKDLEKRLKPLQRDGLIDSWHDREISPGADFKQTIDKHLGDAHIILLLVSPDFIASEYCYEIEMKRAMERHHNGEARVIPIILRDVDWSNALFAGLQVLPKDGLPVTNPQHWPNPDLAWLDIAAGIKKAAEEFKLKHNLHLQQLNLIAHSKPSRIPFTNREDEMSNILSAIAPTYHLIHAPFGLGKTELLKRLKQRFEERDWYCCHVSLNEQSPDTMLATEIAKQFNINLTRNTASHKKSFQIGQRLSEMWLNREERGEGRKSGFVLLIDFEDIPSSARFHELTEYFLPEMQSSLRLLNDFATERNRFRIIIAGRTLGTLWMGGEMTLPWTIMRLSPFSFDVIRRSVRDYLPNYVKMDIDQLAAHLFFITGGHPGCTAHALELFKEVGSPPDEFLKANETSIWSDITRPSVESILFEISESDAYLRDSLERMSVFRFLDYGILRELNEGLIPATLDEYQLADSLTSRLLFDWKGRFLRDELSQRMLTIKLRYENPDEFAKRCKQAVQICSERLRSSNVNSPEIWTIEHLYQWLQCNVTLIYTPATRRALRDSFYEQIRQVLEIFYDRNRLGKHWRVEKHTLLQAIEEDWEFHFTVNYYLRDDYYTETPFNSLLQQIKLFFA